MVPAPRLAVLASLIAAAGWAADKPAPSPVDGTLHMAGGDYLAGRLRDTDPGPVVRWESPGFAEPLAFAPQRLGAVHFTRPAERRPAAGLDCFELTGGDVAFGKLLALDEQQAEIEVTPGGRLQIRRDRLQRFSPWRDASSLVYLGPNGLSEWKQEAPVDGWHEESGQLISDRDGACSTAISPCRPDADRAGLGVERAAGFRGGHGRRSPAAGGKASRFRRVPIGAQPAGNRPGSPARPLFQLEVWQRDLVALFETDRVADVAVVQKLEPGVDRVRLQLYLDQEKGRLLVRPGTADRWPRWTGAADRRSRSPACG